jgi:hypothetical protein
MRILRWWGWKTAWGEHIPEQNFLLELENHPEGACHQKD